MKEFEAPTVVLTSLSQNSVVNASNEFPFLPSVNSTDTNDLGIIQLN